MSGIILLSDLEAASNTDILADTRLQTVPSNGWLAFEMQGSDGVAAHHFVASVKLPGGAIPLDSTWVPAGATAGLAGILDDRTALRVRFRVGQGGHCVFGAVLTGSAEMIWRVTFTPFQ